MEASTIISICIGCFGFVFGVYQYVYSRMQKRIKTDTSVEKDIQRLERLCEERHQGLSVVYDIQRDVGEMKVAIAGIQTFQDNLWKILDLKFAELLHSPTHHRRDMLVDKLVSGELTIEEAGELAVLLDEAFTEELNPDKKLAAAFLRARVEAFDLRRDRLRRE